MSRIFRNLEDSWKLPFYKLDDVSKMRLLKTHPHNLTGLAIVPGTRDKTQLKETPTLQQGKSHPSKPCRIPLMWRGGRAEKAQESTAYRRCGGGEAGKALRQTNHSEATKARQALVDIEGNTGAIRTEESCQ